MAVVCKQCHWCAKNVGGINLLGNFMLLGVKLLGGIFGHSQALIADAIHSLSDVLIALLLIVSLKMSSTPPDEDHHWGHGNIEFIASAIIGLLLICAAVSIAVVAVTTIMEGADYDPGIMAVWAAAISIATNELLFRQSLCVGQQMDSPVMIANAWENRTDVYSSLAALIGVFGARFGYTYLDSVAAGVVGFMIARTGVEILISGVRGMTDRSFDRPMLTRVKKLVLKEEDVRDVTRLRARKIGQKHWVDLEASFDPQLKVSEVKRVVERIKKSVMDDFERVQDVMIIPRAAEPGLKETQP